MKRLLISLALLIGSLRLLWDTWQTPPTIVPLQVPSADQLNIYRDNFNYLFNPNKASVLHVNGSAYTTNSTSFTNVDATNVSLSVVSNGGLLRLGFSVTVQTVNSAHRAPFTLTVDGVNIGHATYGLAVALNADFYHLSWEGYYAVSAGTRVIRLQFRTEDATYATTIPANTPIALYAIAH